MAESDHRTPLIEGPTISLLDADADLADVISPEEPERARQDMTTSTFDVAAGPFGFDEGTLAGSIGLLIVTGVVLRETLTGETSSGELLGPGDAIVPTVDAWGEELVSSQVRWAALVPTRCARLDAELIARLSDWPQTLEIVLRRMAERSRRQAVIQALCHNPRIDARLRGLFWHLADRWGRVTPAGVVVPLRFTHETLAGLVGAQRPTVSTALKGLADSGEITRRPDGAWVLRPDSKDRVHRLEQRHVASAQPHVEIVADDEDGAR